jgi:hypothetical protein
MPEVPTDDDPFIGVARDTDDTPCLLLSRHPLGEDADTESIEVYFTAAVGDDGEPALILRNSDDEWLTAVKYTEALKSFLADAVDQRRFRTYIAVDADEFSALDGAASYPDLSHSDSLGVGDVSTWGFNDEYERALKAVKRTLDNHPQSPVCL